jgi:hypothetical protein
VGSEEGAKHGRSGENERKAPKPAGVEEPEAREAMSRFGRKVKAKAGRDYDDM